MSTLPDFYWTDPKTGIRYYGYNDEWDWKADDFRGRPTVLRTEPRRYKLRQVQYYNVPSPRSGGSDSPANRSPEYPAYSRPKPTYRELVRDRETYHRADAEAKRRIASETAAPMPMAYTAAEYRKLTPPKPEPLVHGLATRDGETLTFAPDKAGKTTFIHNLIPAVVDEQVFLDRYQAQPLPEGKNLVLLDTEMHEGLLHESLMRHGIESDAWAVIPMLGAESSFNITDPACLADWIARLRELDCGYFILDCLAPVFGALGIPENDNTIVGGFLSALRRLRIECGASGMMAVHHEGNEPGRPRGASRLRGWTSDNIRLSADHKLSAKGRIVGGNFPAQKLSFDETTGRLWVATSEADLREAEEEQDMYDRLLHKPGVSVFSMAPRNSAARRNYQQILDRMAGKGLAHSHIGHRSDVRLWYPSDSCPGKSKSDPCGGKLKI